MVEDPPHKSLPALPGVPLDHGQVPVSGMKPTDIRSPDIRNHAVHVGQRLAIQFPQGKTH